MRIGLVGYGMGGRIFHAPFIEAADGVDLVGIVTTNASRRAEAEADFPGVPLYDSLDALLDAGVDAVTITTPPATRRDLVLRAVNAGVAVVADKPFAPTADDARSLVRSAQVAGVPLSVFHNRRWDTDIRTMKAVIERGEVGDVWRVESRFDLAEASTLDAGPEGGLLRDLGTHLVDQMLWLLGPVRQVYACLDWIDLPEGRTDAGFGITMRHESGATSTVSASKCNAHQEKSMRVYGSGGSYVSTIRDVQAAAVFGGRRPAEVGDAWGYEEEDHWGTLFTEDGERRIPSERGAYQDYYTQFATAVAGAGEVPVTGDEAVATLEVLDAARRSDAEGTSIDLPARG